MRIGLSCCACVLFSTSSFADVNSMLLPSPFPVYVIENQGVVNHEVPGSTKVLLPTDNSYTASPGCYIACYSHTKGLYAVSSDIYVMGQVRTKGQYTQRICQPDGFVGKDISAASQFKQLCAEKIDACRNSSCWAGGDTGGWFGVQP